MSKQLTGLFFQPVMAPMPLWHSYLAGKAIIPTRSDLFQRYFINLLNAALFANHHGFVKPAAGHCSIILMNSAHLNLSEAMSMCKTRGFSLLDFNHSLMMAAPVRFVLGLLQNETNKKYLIINWRWTIRAPQAKNWFTLHERQRIGYAQERLSSPGRQSSC